MTMGWLSSLELSIKSIDDDYYCVCAAGDIIGPLAQAQLDVGDRGEQISRVESSRVAKKETSLSPFAPTKLTINHTPLSQPVV